MHADVLLQILFKYLTEKHGVSDEVQIYVKEGIEPFLLMLQVSLNFQAIILRVAIAEDLKILRHSADGGGASSRSRVQRIS